MRRLILNVALLGIILAPRSHATIFQLNQAVLLYDNNGYINAGSVDAFFPDGSVAIRRSSDGVLKRADINNIARTQGCVGRFCVGEEVVVLYRDHYKNSEKICHGLVKGFFDDGTIAVLAENWHRVQDQALASLKGSAGDLKVGDFIVADKGSQAGVFDAEIVGFFSPSLVAVRSHIAGTTYYHQVRRDDIARKGAPITGLGPLEELEQRLAEQASTLGFAGDESAEVRYRLPDADQKTENP